MLKVEEDYLSGIPQTVLQAFVSPGVGWHWTAGGTGRAGWDGTVRHLIASRYKVNASYHGGFWHEHATETTVLQWIVRTTRAAHSVNPAQCWQYHATKPRAIQDARFAEVRRILGAKASDPNAGMLAIAYAGMPADLERDLACPVFRADVQDLARQLVDRPIVIDRPHFGHGWIQPLTRYEMDVAVNFISLLYGEEEDVNEHVRDMEPVYNRSVMLASGATARSAPLFNPKNYDEFRVFALGKDSSGPLIGWVSGSNLTLSDGTVYDARTRWAVTWSRGTGFVFWHERDVRSINVVERVETRAEELLELQSALDAANTRTAAVKTSAAASLRKGAVASRDVATGLEAAAKTVEGM